MINVCFVVLIFYGRDENFVLWLDVNVYYDLGYFFCILF